MAQSAAPDPTNEQTPEQPELPVERVETPTRTLRATLRIGELDYSTLRVYDGDDTERVVEWAKMLHDIYVRHFPPEQSAGWQDAEPRQSAPTLTSPQPQRRTAGGTEHPYPVRVFCGKGHEGVECIPSKRNKTQDDTEWGQLPASWMHRDGDGWCSNYLSQAIIEPK